MGVYTNTAIVVGDVKEALLYFDYVIPVNMNGQFIKLFPHQKGITIDDFPDEKTYRDIVERDLQAIIAFIPSRFQNDENFGECLREMNTYLFHFLMRLHHPERIPTYDIQLPWHTSTMHDLREMFKGFIHELGLIGVFVDCPTFVNASNDVMEPVAILSGLRLIDVANLTIKQIVEFRKDEEAINKMRRFRLFAYENYTGKGKAFVEDDILIRLADYEAVVKKWGFNTKYKALTFLMNSKPLASALTASFLSALCGSPAAAIAAAGTGIGFELGRLSLELSKQRHDFAEAVRDNPMSYIANAKEKLTKTATSECKFR